MAPKRGRESTGFAVSKKPAKAGAEVPKLLGMVSKAIDSDTGLPEAVITFLVNAVPNTLSDLKEERHAYQEQVVGMIGEALEAKRVALEKAAADAAAALAEVTSQKAKLAGEVTDAEAAATALAEALTAAQTKADEDAKAFKAAVDAVKDAETKQAKGDAELVAAEAAKTELETVQKEHLLTLVEGAAADVKASVKAVQKAAKSFSSDQSLLDSIPSTFSKAKDARGTFDGLVIKQVEEACAKRLAELEQTLSAGAAGKEERAAAVASSTEAREAAKAAQEASDKALAEAKAATKAGDTKVKDTKAAAKKFEPDVKKAQKDSESHAATLEAFKAGALDAFDKLKDRVPPPAPVEEEAPAEEALAAEAPAADAPAAEAAAAQ